MVTAVGRVEARVSVAIEALLKADANLLALDASERAIAHRLACHLTDVLPGWDVDCEYNRDRHDPKTLQSLSHALLDGQLEKRVYPDIVVHHRNSDDNLLVVEVKKTTGEQSNVYDLAKLKAYRTDLGYQYALFVRFATGVDTPRVAELRWIETGPAHRMRQ